MSSFTLCEHYVSINSMLTIYRECLDKREQFDIN